MTNFFDKDFPWDVTEQVRKFQAFLNASWPCLDDLMKYHDWDEDMDLSDDFIQVNWELLVERELLGQGRYLMPLCAQDIPRMTEVEAIPTHVIIAQVKNDIHDVYSEKLFSSGTKLRLAGLLSFVKERGLGLYPPFDVAKLVMLDTKKKAFYIPLLGLTFLLDELRVYNITFE